MTNATLLTNNATPKYSVGQAVKDSRGRTRYIAGLSYSDYVSADITYEYESGRYVPRNGACKVQHYLLFKTSSPLASSGIGIIQSKPIPETSLRPLA